MSKATEKMGIAKAKLVIDYPFYAAMALSLRLIETNDIPTMATDSVVLMYNPAFVDSLKLNEVIAVVCHEVLHVVMLHPFRRDGRDPKKWNYACDYAVNEIIKSKTHFTLPENCLYNRAYQGMSAEEIFTKLTDKDMANLSIMDVCTPGDVKDYEQGITTLEKGEGKEGDEGNPYEASNEQQEQTCKMKIQQALNAAKMQGKLPGELKELISDVLMPKLSWREILARFLTENSTNDYSWRYPNARYLYSDLYLPKLHEPQLGQIVVMVDTSASVCTYQLSLAAAEIRAALQTYPNTELIILYIDTKVQDCIFATVADFELEAKGRGCTNFRPGFAYIEENNLDPVCVLYFTDGECNSFPKEPDYSVLWLLTHRYHRWSPPFGETILIEE